MCVCETLFDMQNIKSYLVFSPLGEERKGYVDNVHKFMINRKRVSGVTTCCHACKMSYDRFGKEFDIYHEDLDRRSPSLLRERELQLLGTQKQFLPLSFVISFL